SAIRPQRGSRAISTIGEYAQFNPSAAASVAAMRALCSIIGISHEQDKPSGMGNIVLCPCITSSPNIKGIFSLELFTAISCALRKHKSHNQVSINLKFQIGRSSFEIWL